MSPSNKSQYHHFVPRFILRNFQDDSKCAPPSGSTNGHRKGGRNRGRGRPDGEISYLNLETMNMKSQLVSRVFGLSDMYKVDLGNDTDPYHLEKKLSKLESDAAQLLTKAKDTFAVEGAVLTLSRRERNQLRRFFFLMKYRGGGQHERFNHASIETYDSDDKHRMRAYMKAKGFTRPKDVWQANLDAFMTIEMDAKGEWMSKILAMAFEDDAMMFIAHVQCQYMSFCRSRSYEKEFFITENAYAIFEGLNSTLGNGPGPYTEFHTFAPIGPHLLVVFRSFLLRSGLEDEQQEDDRLAMLAPHLDIHGLKKCESELESLPIRKPQMEYVQVRSNDTVDRSTTKSATSIEHRIEDKFFFECFTIFHNHVEFINDLLLEQTYGQSLIAFRNRKHFAGAVRAYLLRRRRGFKIVTSDTGDKQRPFLDALGVFVSRELGEKIQPVYRVVTLPNPHTHMSSWTTRHVVLAIHGGQRPDLSRLLKGLAGEASTPIKLHEDILQVSLMMFFRIKIDTIMTAHSLDNAKEEKVRTWCREMYCGAPARRVWLYLKVARNMDGLSERDYNILQAPLELDGPEDLFLKEFGNVGLDEHELSVRMLMLDRLARGGH